MSEQWHLSSREENVSLSADKNVDLELDDQLPRKLPSVVRVEAPVSNSNENEYKGGSKAQFEWNDDQHVFVAASVEIPLN